MIVCETLGPPVVRLDDGSVPATLQWHKNLALLVYLARSPKRARARDHLIGLLWCDEAEKDARHSLNQAVSTLRTYAGESIETDRTHVRLADGAVSLDVEQIDACAAAGDYAAAARLIAGVFLEGFSISGASGFDDWMASERTHWQRRSVAVLECLSNRALAHGDLAGAEDAAHRAEQIDEHSDVAVRARLRTLALAGDRGQALKAFTAFAERLQRDLGAEPDPETRALADRIRQARAWRLPETASAPTGPESRRAPLVGRTWELERLVATWATCRAGRSGVVIVEGDGGTGKTRLAEELTGRARLDGAVIAAVRAVEADRSDPWSGVLGIARGGLLDAPGIAAAPPATLAGLRGSAPLAAPARAVSEALRVVADEQPVMIVVDDAHWLDRESLLALGAAARELRRSRVFLLIHAAPHERREELDQVRAHLGRDLAGTGVMLGPLDADALRALARWGAASYDAMQVERLARRIVADSAGIPLLAVELLNAVALGLDLQAVRGAWPQPLRTLQQTFPGDLPDAITAAVRVNFHRLSPDAQGVLLAAAVFDRRLPAGGAGWGGGGGGGRRPPAPRARGGGAAA